MDTVKPGYKKRLPFFLAIAAIVVGFVWVSQARSFFDRQKTVTALYIAVETKPPHIGNLPVDIRVDNDLCYKQVANDKIPVISLRPGRHTVRVSAKGYSNRIAKLSMHQTQVARHTFMPRWSITRSDSME